MGGFSFSFLLLNLLQTTGFREASLSEDTCNMSRERYSFPPTPVRKQSVICDAAVCSWRRKRYIHHCIISEVMGFGHSLRPPRSSVVGEGLNTSFLSLQCSLQILNHSAFSLENLTFQRQTWITWSSSAATCPCTCLARAASRATLP